MIENSERYSIKFIDDDVKENKLKIKTLHIIDALPIFYKSAYKIKEVDKFSLQPLVRFLYEVSEILKQDSEADIVVCNDSRVRVKYELYGGESIFKKNRQEKSEVSLRHMDVYNQGLKILCDKIGICLQKIEGYEADDLIYETFLRYRTSYDKIVIHSADSDMYFMVNDIVEIDRGDFGILNKQNFEKVLSKTVYVPYNAAPFYSMYKPKDNRGRIYIDRYRELIAIASNANQELFTNAEVTRILARDVFKLTEDEMLILNLALPTPVLDEYQDYVKPIIYDIDYNIVSKLCYGLRACNLNDADCNEVITSIKSNW